LYEVLLDDFEDDVTPHPDEFDLDDKADEPLDLDDDVDADELALDADAEADLAAAEEILSESEDGE